MKPSADVDHSNPVKNSEQTSEVLENLNAKLERLDVAAPCSDGPSCDPLPKSTTRRNVLSGGRIVTPRAHMRMGGANSPGVRYEKEENHSFTYMDSHIQLQERLEYRGNGTFYEIYMEDEQRILKAFKYPKGVAELEDEIDNEIEICRMLQQVYNGFVFPYLLKVLFAEDHRMVVFRHDFGNILTRFVDEPASINAIRIILYQVMIALRALALKHIIHFNVRLENIRVTRPDGYYIKLRIDNCAKIAETISDATKFSSEKEARSPEIILGYELPTYSTDVYASAMAMQRLYFGQYPWFAECKDRAQILNDSAILQGLDARIGKLSDGLIASATHRREHFDGKLIKHVEIKIGKAKRKLNMNDLDDGEQQFLDLTKRMLAYTDRPTATQVMRDTFLKVQYIPKANEYQKRLTQMKNTILNLNNLEKSRSESRGA